MILEETVTSLMAFVGEMSVPFAEPAELERDVFGNKNRAISEGGSRTKTEQSEGAGAVSG